jgi:hypothetical protein
MLGTAHAQEACDDIKWNYDWQFLNVAVELNVPQHKLCVGLASSAGQVKSITPSQDNPFCWDVSEGSTDDRAVTPEITLTDGTIVKLTPMNGDDARKTATALVAKCKDSPSPN